MNIREWFQLRGSHPPHHLALRTGTTFWWLEAGVIALIAGMSAFDAYGFFQTMQLISRTDDPATTGAIVGALTVVAVAIPTFAGAFKSPLAWLLWLVWAVIGAIIFITRLGGAPPTPVTNKALGQVQTTTSTDIHAYVIPSLYAMVYVVTGVVAYLHASKLAADAKPRLALRTHNQILDLEKDLKIWQNAKDRAKQEEAKIEGILTLDKQANTAREQVAREMAYVEIIRQLGDPAATERILKGAS